EEAPFAALRWRDWLEAAVRFLISDAPDRLNGLPIALLANGKLAAFGLAQAGCTFAATAKQRHLFAPHPYCFIDPDFMTATGLGPHPADKFYLMNAKHVTTNLP